MSKKDNAARHPRSRVDTSWLTLIALLAAAVRVVYWIQTGDNPFRDLLVLDSRVYHLLALDIANGNFWGDEVFFRAPLFPYLLALTYKLFGTGGLAIKIISGALGVATALMTHAIAEIHFDRRTARIAGVIAALYPTLYFYESSLMPTALEVFTFTATIYFLSRYQLSGKNFDLIAAGLALGYGATARPTILSFLLVIPLWLWLLNRNRDLKLWARELAFVAVPIAIIILPITIRNYVIEPKVVLISSQGGSNFYIGNNRHADGQTVAFPTGNRLNKYDDHIWSASQQVAESETRKQLTAAEVSEYWLEKGIAEVWTNPIDGIKLTLRKVYLFFCGEEIFNNTDPLAQREFASVYSLFIWRKLINFPYGLLAPLFLVGTLWLLFSRDKRPLLLLFVWSQVVTVALFFVSSRFRQPVLPVMIIVTVWAVLQAFAAIRSRNRKPTIAAAVAFLVLVYALNPAQAVASRQNRSMYHAYLGGALAAQEKFPEAVEQLRQAIIIADDNPTAFQLLGSLYVKSGQFEQALAVLQRAEQLAPEAVPTLSTLGRIYFDLDQHERALGYFDKVLASGARIEGLSTLAARSALALGDTTRCRGYLDQALKSNAADSTAIRLRSLID